IELLCIEHHQDIINITASIGVVTSQENMSKEEIINQAEQCLQHAKTSGKNKVSTLLDTQKNHKAP
ncbi:diguanylate cyclase, partial [Psychromonas sp.]|nr:diguanylate cyclase [Psychromonas sp.]